MIRLRNLLTDPAFWREMLTDSTFWLGFLWLFLVGMAASMLGVL